jgi:hypothetical protein
MEIPDGIRPSSSSSMVISNGSNQTLRNAFSHSPLNLPEKYLRYFISITKILLLEIHLEQMVY